MSTCAAALSLALALSACATPSTPRLDACPPIAAHYEGWTRVDLGPFSMELPPGFERVDVQPIDSRAGTFRHGLDGSEITYDYGWYSNDLPPDPIALIGETRSVTTWVGCP